jgi:hypothetical protein
MSTFREPADYLRLAIESVLNQTFSNFEFLIAIDDPDNCEHVRIMQEYVKKDPRIIWYVNKENLGLPKSLNELISRSKGKYIARMDADDISLPERFEKQVQYLESNKKVGILGAQVYKMNEDGEIYGSVRLPSSEKCIKIYIENGVMPICHPSWLVRKEVYKILKGYRNVPYSEDFDFVLRAFKNGVVIANLSEPLLKYRIHSHKYKISSSKAYAQYISTKLCHKQFKKGEFSDIAGKSHSKFGEKLYNLANYFFTKSMDYRSQHKLMPTLFFFLLSFISPARAEFNLRIMKAKFNCYLAGK